MQSIATKAFAIVIGGFWKWLIEPVDRSTGLIP